MEGHLGQDGVLSERILGPRAAGEGRGRGGGRGEGGRRDEEGGGNVRVGRRERGEEDEEREGEEGGIEGGRGGDRAEGIRVEEELRIGIEVGRVGVSPVAQWRSAVRKFLNCREMESFRQKSELHPTLAVLAAAARKSLDQRITTVTCTPSPTNWIRIRLLCGTSALNCTMGRYTRTDRSRSCPMCNEDEESVQHFLRDCSDPRYVHARVRHVESMPSGFSALSSLQQCAFILGCSVIDPSNTLSTIMADSEQDNSNVTLVHELTELRKRKLTNKLGGMDPGGGGEGEEVEEGETR